MFNEKNYWLIWNISQICKIYWLVVALVTLRQKDNIVRGVKCNYYDKKFLLR